MLEPKLYVESVSGSIVFAWVVDAKRLPVTLPVKLPVIASIFAKSAWIFDHWLVLEPKLYVASWSGTIVLESVGAAYTNRLTVPTKLPVVVSIEPE